MDIRAILIFINRFVPFIFKRYCLLDSSYSVDSNGNVCMNIVNVNNNHEIINCKLLELVKDDKTLKKLDSESLSMVFITYGLFIGCKESGSYKILEINQEQKALKTFSAKTKKIEYWTEKEFYDKISLLEKNSILRAVYFFGKKNSGGE